MEIGDSPVGLAIEKEFDNRILSRYSGQVSRFSRAGGQMTRRGGEVASILPRPGLNGRG